MHGGVMVVMFIVVNCGRVCVCVCVCVCYMMALMMGMCIFLADC
jgi:hypothetical protein